MGSQRSAVARIALSVVAVVLLGYLTALAASPGLRLHVPPTVQWFGEPGSAMTIAVVTVVLALLGLFIATAQGVRQPGAPVAIVVGLALLSLVLGLASYWRCHDETHPLLFTPLIWTASLLKGGVSDQSLAGQTCPAQTPVALEVARLSVLTAIFLSVVGVALALLQSRLDRLRVGFARSVTAVVDIDDDAASMLGAIARTLGRRDTLAVITDAPDRPCVQAARISGARIISVDFDQPEALAELPVWRKLDRLYLLSADPSSNLLRLAAITSHLAKIDQRQRIPLIMRIDDPWQAGAWRAQHFGGADTRWAADAVGKYEVTACRLLDRITANPAIQRILICGSSRLMLALCTDMAQRQVEWDYYADPAKSPPPKITLVAENAEEYRQDHEFACAQAGLVTSQGQIETVSESASAATVMSLISAGGAASTAVILVDADTGVDLSVGTRLAARFPTTPIYGWDPSAQVTEDRLALVGQLRTYRLSMDLPGGQAQDTWERAARLIHDRYAAAVGHDRAATLPWDKLDEFYRGSNRREVQNALWMVEKIGGHTWNTFGGHAHSQPTAKLYGLEPLEQLRLMGFERDTAVAMARAEHEDWSRYYRAAGWKYGTVRDDASKVHDKLVDWSAIEADPELLRTALTSLAATLSKLRELGYRSMPTSTAAEWQTFRRVGTVVAEQRWSPWTWNTRSGATLQAEAGDWAVREPDGDHCWSVRDDIFRSRYEQVEGDHWRRLGTVEARPAANGETVSTLEGPVTTSTGDWVIQGEHDDQWPVPAEAFARRYQGPISG